MSHGASAGERILTRLLEEEMRESFLDYSMSVIVQRALPDARDGLKPVHRRIVYAMYGLGLLPERPYKKSATVVGDVLGKYHPHGDSAVYDALVRMAQEFSLRIPLIDGQGNFGSIDGDPAAAYRYTEARLASVAVELIDDVRKETVDFQPNFDGSAKEPVVLPGRFPNLLVNGSAGIAVGMSTNVPPHNLAEVAAGVRQLAIDPECDVRDLMRHVPGPDFPTGGFIVGRDGIRGMYSEGRGRVQVRARIMKETLGSKERLVVNELPYGVSKNKVIEQIARTVKLGRAEAISDVRDESDREGMRLVIEMKRNTDAARLISRLHRSTSLRVTFGAQLLALDGGEPRIFTLKGLLEAFRDHRLEVIRRRSRHDLEKALAEREIVEGLLAALARIDEVVRVIRSSENRKEAALRLRAALDLSETQAGAILDMRLARLTALERVQLEARLDVLRAEIDSLRELLSSEELQLEVMLDELQEVVESHGGPRRTVILDKELEDGGELELEERLAEEDVVVTFTRKGFVRRIPMHIYRRRMASGKPLVQSYAEDHLESVFVARSLGNIVAFSEEGNCFVLPVSEVPKSSAAHRGKSVYSLVEGATRDDRLVSVMPAGDLGKDERIAVFATRQGMVKRTRLSEFANARKTGVIAIGLREGDALAEVRLSGGASELLVVSRQGRAIRFSEADVSVVGRSAQGVKAMSLDESGDAVVAMLLAHHRADLLTVTRGGWARRVPMTEFPLQKRGGLGTLLGIRGDDVAAALDGSSGRSVLLVTGGGESGTMRLDAVPIQGKRGRGRQIMRLVAGDYVERVGIASADDDEGEEGASVGGASRFGAEQAQIPDLS